MPSSFLEWAGFLAVVVVLALVFERFTRGVKSRLGRRIAGIVFMLIVVAVLSKGQEFYNNVFTPTVTPTSVPTRTPRPTFTPQPLLPTRETCYLWNQVTPSMEGKRICVYGTVHAVYVTNETATRIRFTAESNRFFLFSSNYVFKDLAAGSCVQAYGVVELYERIPFLNIGDELYYCDP